MTPDTISISKPSSPRTSLDFDALYKLGIGHIESLSGKLWTDYNSHDPGITILEVLCYAITELGYRCDFEIGDIIAPDPNNLPAQPDFFTLAEVASNAPLTINDYRKLLIDLPGIRNAWLELSERGEFPIYLDLVTANSPQLLSYPVGSNIEVKIQGLYKVYIQFEEDKDYGDLNDNSISSILMLDLIGGDPEDVPIETEIEFPIWEDLSDELEELWDSGALLEFDVVQTVALTENTDESYVYTTTLQINPSGRAIDIPLSIRIVSGQEEILNKNDFENKLNAELSANTYDPILAFLDQSWLIQVLVTFLERRSLIQNLLEDVSQTLAEHRNLCEDFMAVYPMSLQEIGLNLELEVKSGTDLEEVLAEVYQRMEQYLSPPIQFYSLREMLNRGYEPDRIFQGPVLNNGFIDEEELSFHQRREILYTSDLVQEFMKIEGVTAVKQISLSRYLKGEIQDIDQAEYLILEEPERFLPRLNYTRSDVFMDNGEGQNIEPDRLVALDILSEYKALDQLKGTAGKSDFTLPEGDYSNLDDYYSIQHEFPANYGIGEEGLSPEESNLRKAQAHQMKTFLLFFEQLLADFMTQLANVRELYSYQEEGERTYFTNALYNVPQVQELLADFTDAGNTLNWEDYQALLAPGPDHYKTRLNTNAENEETFHDRRQRFLDHLMGRFNESFTDYASYIFSTGFPEANQYSTLISDQVRFLRNYPEHSHDRGASFNYKNIIFDSGFSGLDFWDSDFVTGLKKRMVYLTGLPKVERERISPFHYFNIQTNMSGKFIFELDNPDGFELLIHLNEHDTEDELLEELTIIVEIGQEIENYVDNGGTIELQETLYDESLGMDVTITYAELAPEIIAEAGDVDSAILATVTYLMEIGNIENLHIIEHVLLRPRETSGKTLDVRIDEDCPGISICDPYSFRISVILPSWAGRFEEFEYRKMFKRIMRLECPAHVYIHFYWIDASQMYKFELCWEDWLNGEWLIEDSRILQESSTTGNPDVLLQENQYDLLIDRGGNTGEDGKFFVECIGKLKNLYDAYYTLAPSLITDQYEDKDVLAFPTDPDGTIIKAWLSDESGPLPPGTSMDPCTGVIIVEDASLLADALDEYPLEIITLSSSGEVTYHNIVIQFIPNGPSEVDIGPIVQHIGKYSNGDVILSFRDTDDGHTIIQAILTGTLPPGTEMDPITGTVTVTDETLLVDGQWPISVDLMDSEGGNTTLGVTLEILPDTEAVYTIFAPPTKNQDAYLFDDVVITVTDVDDGVVSLVPRGGQPALSEFGLDVRLVGSPFQAEIFISDLPAFQTALTSRYTLSGGFYTYTFRLRSTDGCNGITNLNITLRIRRDSTPVVTPFAPISVDQLGVGDVLCEISDPVDLGLDSAVEAAPTNLASLGMEIVVSGGIAKIQIANMALFLTAVGTVFADIGSSAQFTFPVDTVDNTGGIATVTAIVRTIPDEEPETVTLPAKNQDVVVFNEKMAFVIDPDGGGILTATEAASNPFSLASKGLEIVVGSDGSYPGEMVGIVRISNTFWFRWSLSSLANWVEINPANKTFQLTFDIDTVDINGGTGTVTVAVEVIKDYTGGVLEEANGATVDTYSTGSVLWRFSDDDPNGSLVSFSSSPSLLTIPGVSSRKVGGEYEIYVNNASQLDAGTHPLTITVNDSTGGISVYNITVEIKPRRILISFLLDSMGFSSRVLSLANQAPGMSVLTVANPVAPNAFGTIGPHLANNIYFTEGTGFATSVGGHTWDYTGEISATGEAIEGTITITRRIFIINFGSGSGTRLSGAGDGLSGFSGNATGLASKTGRVVDEINNAKNYPDNPLLESNPSLIGAFATGKKDEATVGSLEKVITETTDEIVRLQDSISAGGDKAAEKTELQAVAGLLQAQVKAAIDFAGEIRMEDIGEDGPVKGLFDTIGKQMGRIK